MSTIRRLAAMSGDWHFSDVVGLLGASCLDKDAQAVIAAIQRVYSVLTGKELSEE